MKRRPAGIRAVLAISLLTIGGTADAAAAEEYGRYLSTDQFLELAFGDNPPEPQTLWITREHREPLERLLNHPFGSLRLRYWRDGNKTSWILNETGKELPITIGVTVKGGAIESVRILEFREIRGWEVRYPFFTDQFRGAVLAGNGELDTEIDGITGATLSVSAVKRVARAALYLHEQVTTGE
ncbi:MAG: FMN-binding protein [Woeseiaceae bacterium]